jgi:hypothetical protein
MEQLVALAFTKKVMGSNLLVVSTNSIRFVFVGTREFLAIMVRVRVASGSATSLKRHLKETSFPPYAPQMYLHSWVSASSFGHVPIMPPGWISHS